MSESLDTDVIIESLPDDLILRAKLSVYCMKVFNTSTLRVAFDKVRHIPSRFGTYNRETAEEVAKTLRQVGCTVRLVPIGGEDD